MIGSYCRAARTGPDGSLIPFDEQDRRKWDRDRVGEGIALISVALPAGRVGPYQVQAAIAAVHDGAQTMDATGWPQILALCDVLGQIAPGPVVSLNGPSPWEGGRPGRGAGRAAQARIRRTAGRSSPAARHPGRICLRCPATWPALQPATGRRPGGRPASPNGGSWPAGRRAWPENDTGGDVEIRDAAPTPGQADADSGRSKQRSQR
jgi:hypothetical protein